MIPFVRLDLSEDPIGEATRCLDLGARGIKLHPRAQKFRLDDDRLTPVFALAAERRVPILIHGGRGLPPIGDHLHQLVDAYPEAQLIIAHAGIADLDALAGHFAGKAGVFFDTSVWSPIDLLSFFNLVPPEQVVYASDYPYGQQPASLLIALRTARVAGLDEGQIRAHAARERGPHRGRRRAARADEAVRYRRARATARARAHPPVPLDGDADALDAPGRHDRRARARAERVRCAQRPRGGAGADPRAADRRAGSLADAFPRSRTRASSGS